MTMTITLAAVGMAVKLKMNMHDDGKNNVTLTIMMGLTQGASRLVPVEILM